MNKLQASIIFVGLIVLAFLGFRYYKDLNKEQALPPLEEPKVVVDQVDSTQLPDRFPANFPLEKNVPINANYTAQAEGAFQSTRQFISKKTLAENYKLYSDYLKKDGWKIEATLDQEMVKSIFATKGRASVTVTMAQNTTTSESTVDISFVYR